MYRLYSAHLVDRPCTEAGLNKVSIAFHPETIFGQRIVTDIIMLLPIDDQL